MMKLQSKCSHQSPGAISCEETAAPHHLNEPINRNQRDKELNEL